MIINGVYEPNITCKACRHRHPATIGCEEAKLIAERTRDKHEAKGIPIRSAHVIMVPWCQCCAALVPVDHICACEVPSENA